MDTQRFFAIFGIFLLATLAWTVLGRTIDYRTDKLNDSLSSEINHMLGPEELIQCAPHIEASTGSDIIQPSASDIAAEFTHHHRYKGLLWFSTYTVKFTGKYVIPERAPETDGSFIFRLPPGAPTFENLWIELDGKRIDAGDNLNHLQVKLPDSSQHIIKVAYTTRARDRWLYSSKPHTQSKLGELKNFVLRAKMDFNEIDYPKGSASPTTPASSQNSGMLAEWKYDNLRANQSMGIEMPRRANAGPIAARMSFFAPVSLLFFFTVMFTVVVLKKIPLHPMHYLLISAGFFSFHILLAYLVDILSIHASFWICAGVSVLLVVSYMRLVAGVRFAVLYVGLAQLIYLVGFSYAFFWVGKTGLAVTIGAIITLFVLMQATGRIDWHEVFKKDLPGSPLPPPIPQSKK